MRVDVMISKPSLVILALVLPLLASCQRQSETVLTGHPVYTRDIAQLAIGQSTRDDVERLFGEPDERGDDGSLTYRATAVRRTGRSVVGWSLADAAEVVGQQSATFRFAGGVLSRICRTRS
jgi:hypothetical protein